MLILSNCNYVTNEMLAAEEFLKPWGHIEHCRPHFLSHTYLPEVLVFDHCACQNQALQRYDILEKNVV